MSNHLNITPKTLLVGINARYSHTNLAIRYLRQQIIKNGFDVTLYEQSINVYYDQLLREIAKLAKAYDIIAFSAYIWNIELIKSLSQDLNQLYPHKIWIAGGPEVSYDPQNELASGLAVDCVLAGEGERSLVQLLALLSAEKWIDCQNKRAFLNKATQTIEGLFTREMSSKEAFPVVVDLSEIPFPYQEDESLEHRVIYYESSRGCPYNCSYCLSSTLKGVRYLPIERVYKELKWFIDKKVMQVKFVDRTFNADKNRTLSILEFIANHDNGYTQFHFELTAALIDDSLFKVLERVRPGLYQFEIGIQTTNENTSREIYRIQPLDNTLDRCRQLIATGNQHIHMDLIAGLPFETPDTFSQAIDTCMSVGPHMLQIGFLKLLKGSAIRFQKDHYGYLHSHRAPYEVLSSNTFSFEALQEVKQIEELVDHFYNSGLLRLPIRLIGILEDGRYAQFFKGLAQYFSDTHFFERPQKQDEWVNAFKTYVVSKCQFGEYKEAIEELIDWQAARFGVNSAAERLGSLDTNNRQDCFELLQTRHVFSEHPVLGLLSPKEAIKKITVIMTHYDDIALESMLESNICVTKEMIKTWKEKRSKTNLQLIDKTTKHAFSGMYPIYLGKNGDNH